MVPFIVTSTDEGIAMEDEPNQGARVQSLVTIHWATGLLYKRPQKNKDQNYEYFVGVTTYLGEGEIRFLYMITVETRDIPFDVTQNTGVPRIDIRYLTRWGLDCETLRLRTIEKTSVPGFY